tara:strand:- start:2680 stop:3321 length:642 start_codon:yes stop_codon:yes gene_type:complete
MKKMILYITLAVLTSGCFATDLSDLDSLYINTEEGLEVSPGPQPPVVSTTAGQTTVDSESNSEESCDLLFCGNLSSLMDMHREGDKVAFGYNMAQIEGFYQLKSEDVWKRWYDEQYGVEKHVFLVRYIYDKKVNGKTLVIETFYNDIDGKFVFGRVLYQGDYDNMKNFLMKIYYENARPDFNSQEKFKDNPNSKYFSNADKLLKTLTGHIESL